jgi:hypothetical protein
MFKQGKKILLGAGVLAAVSFGGSALAAGAAPVTPVVQHSSGAAQVKGASGSGMETGNEAPGTETADSQGGAQDTETQDGSSESGSEVAGNDGSGGHADEPGQPNAQNQE